MNPQNPLKNRLSKMFRSCNSRAMTDVVERPRKHYQLIELFSPKPYTPVFSMCGPKQSEMEEVLTRPKVTDRYSLHSSSVSPVTPLDTWREFDRGRKYSKKGAKGDTKGRKREKKMDKTTKWTTNITNNYYDWSTSDDDVDSDNYDDDDTTLFSSDSSDSFCRPKSLHSRRYKPMKPKADDKKSEKEGFPVVKRSNDPYNDFRSSMVEMIVERQIFGAKELEVLLHTFLSLNSSDHHKVIIEVFMEILDALFSD